eukprot:924647_1
MAVACYDMFRLFMVLVRQNRDCLSSAIHHTSIMVSLVIESMWHLYLDQIRTVALLVFDQLPILQSLYEFTDIYVIAMVYLTILLSFAVFNTPYIILFFTKPAFAEAYLIQPVAFKKQNNFSFFMKVFNVWMLNMILLLLFIFATSPFISPVYFGWDSTDFKACFEVIKPMPPSLLSCVFDVGRAMIIEDAVFYWTHRAFHINKLYFIHKMHHEVTVPISFSSTYSAPVDFILNMCATLCGLYGCNTIFAFVVWIALRIYTTTEIHSGYKFPWMPDQFIKNSKYMSFVDGVYAGSEHHDAHHQYNNINYSSSLCFWDWLCGTDKLGKKDN